MEDFGNTKVEGAGDKNTDTVHRNSTKRKFRDSEGGHRGQKYKNAPPRCGKR